MWRLPPLTDRVGAALDSVAPALRAGAFSFAKGFSRLQEGRGASSVTRPDLDIAGAGLGTSPTIRGEKRGGRTC